MLTAEQVLALIAASPHVMGVLDGGPCAIEHVSKSNKTGADERLDTCPCGRELDDETPPQQLGGGQYISSPRHTLGDLVRDVVADPNTPTRRKKTV